MTVNREVTILLARKHALHLELKGLTRRGRTVYSICKQAYGLSGNKQKVYDQMCLLVEKVKEAQEQQNES